MDSKILVLFVILAMVLGAVATAVLDMPTWVSQWFIAIGFIAILARIILDRRKRAQV